MIKAGPIIGAAQIIMIKAVLIIAAAQIIMIKAVTDHSSSSNHHDQGRTIIEQLKS